MSETAADPLFRPLRIGSVELPNRIVMAPMTRQFSPGGVPGQNVADYYRRRATGGVGLIVTEGVGIDTPAAVDNPAIPVMHGAAALEGWRAVVDAVHARPVLIFPQLWHQGVLRNPTLASGAEVPPQSPSGYWGTPGHTSYEPDYVERMRRPLDPMTEEEIADVVAAYARSARDAIAVGFDGIAIHGAHGYLIDTFLWADTNRRTDRYGGSAAQRATFAAEVVRAIRREIGDRPIMFRFSQHKQQDYSARIADTPEVLGTMLGVLADAGVDIFDASTRRFSMPAFEGSDLTLAGWARKLTGKPSMTVGGVGLNNWMGDTLRNRSETVAIDNLDEVRRLMKQDQFDLVGVGRALLNDPQWVEKARAGESFLPFERAALARLD